MERTGDGNREWGVEQKKEEDEMGMGDGSILNSLHADMKLSRIYQECANSDTLKKKNLKDQSFPQTIKTFRERTLLCLSLTCTKCIRCPSSLNRIQMQGLRLLGTPPTIQYQ